MIGSVLATLFTVSSDIILAVEFYSNYFAMKRGLKP